MKNLFFLLAFTFLATVNSNAGNNFSNLPVNLDNFYSIKGTVPSGILPTSSKIIDIIDCEMVVKLKIEIVGVSGEITCTGTGHAVTAGDACNQALAAVVDCVNKAKAQFGL